MSTYHKPQHEKFIRSFLKHGDQAKAYRIAYPKTTKESAYIGAIRLMHCPHIRARIEPVLEERYRGKREQALEAAAQRVGSEQEEMLAMRTYLARIINGEIMRERYIVFKGSIVLIEEDLSPYILLSAIELDARMEAGSSPHIVLRHAFIKLIGRIQRGIVDMSEPQIKLISLINHEYTENNEDTNPSEQPNASELVNTNKKTSINEQKLTDSGSNPLQNEASAQPEPVISNAGRNLLTVCNEQHRSTSGDPSPAKKRVRDDGAIGLQKKHIIQQKLTTERSDLMSTNKKDEHLRINSSPNPLQDKVSGEPGHPEIIALIKSFQS